MATRQLFLAAYDIADSKRLHKFLKLLRSYASGGQKSVFECWLSASERKQLLQAAQQLMNPEEDRFMVLNMDPRQQVKTMGKAVMPLDQDWYYLG